MENYTLVKENATDKKANLWAVLMYLSTLANVFYFSNLVFPLILWLLKKDDNEKLDEHGRQILNFQLTLTFIVCPFILIYLLIEFGLMMTLNLSTYIPVYIGYALTILIIIVDVGVMLYGAICAYRGTIFKIPYVFDFLKRIKWFQ